jgi:hypothetical protein
VRALDVLQEMKTNSCYHPSGEVFVLHQADTGLWLCPVCGRESFAEPPYADDGSPSFEMCECGFEFGFDDSHLASSEAVEGIEANWIRWRKSLIEASTHSRSEFAVLQQRLHRIGRRLAFDLIDVPIEKTGEQDASSNH